jgi:purine-binding chemotaxis protein CheW
MNTRNNEAKTLDHDLEKTRDFLTIIIGDQLFGIPILQVQDVLGQQKITRIPLAPPEISGSLNLRGRIVTALNLRNKLGLTPLDADEKYMSVVVEYDHELYSLIIDKVGDVLSLHDDNFEKNPGTLDPAWRDISAGIYRLDNRPLVILDVPKLLDSSKV